MSKCIVHMKKHKMQAVAGLQSHNNREHESKTNKEIDYSKSSLNYDILFHENNNYTKTIKEKISELNLPKAVRSDAVVYCSFIVTSDKNFFNSLGEKEYMRRENEDISVAIGVNHPTPFEYLSEEYKTDCIYAGSRDFFEVSTRFFGDKYGYENIINATVHFDEATPHMHLGIVPRTDDGRLSAKDIFTKVSLKNLQSEFAEIVGEKFSLERGKVGSEAKHLDEIDYKLKVRSEQLEKLDKDFYSKRYELYEINNEISISSAKLSDIKVDIDTLSSQRSSIEQHNMLVEKAIKKKIDTASENYGMGEIKQQIEQTKEIEKMKERLSLLEWFVALPQVKPIFEKCCQLLKSRNKDNNKER